MGPRSGLSTLLVLGSCVLVIAIFIGNGMGNRVLRQVSQAPATLLPIVAPSAAEEGGPNALTLRRRRVTSVATDPAFPDPRITPEPSPSPTRSPVPRATLPPAPLPTPAPEATQSKAPYTSPPLAFPLVKHSPGETSSPDEFDTAAPGETASP